MTDKDNELIENIKFLANCCKDEYNDIRIDAVLLGSLDLINRKQAEIERLQKEVNLVSIQFQDLQERYEEAQTEIERLEKESEDKERAYNDEFCIRKEWQTKCQELLKEEQIIKSEAVKEFAERLKEKSYPFPCAIGVENAVTIRIIDDLAKEMVGDTK